jgi:hypothetical protein
MSIYYLQVLPTVPLFMCFAPIYKKAIEPTCALTDGVSFISNKIIIKLLNYSYFIVLDRICHVSAEQDFHFTSMLWFQS